MNIAVEAIYESGVLKLLSPLPELREHERVRVIVELESVIARQRRERLHLAPEAVRSLFEDSENDLLES